MSRQSAYSYKKILFAIKELQIGAISFDPCVCIIVRFLEICVPFFRFMLACTNFGTIIPNYLAGILCYWYVRAFACPSNYVLHFPTGLDSAVFNNDRANFIFWEKREPDR